MIRTVRRAVALAAALAAAGLPLAAPAGADVSRSTPSIVTAAGFTKLPGTALDIGVGANGVAWTIGTDRVSSDGYGIYRWNGSNWTPCRGPVWPLT